MSDSIVRRTVAAPTPEGAMKALVRSRPGGERTLAVIFHDGPGVRPAVEKIAERIARLGFLAVVPDLYHRLGEFPRFGGPPGSDGHGEMVAAIRSVADGPVVADTGALLETLRGERLWSGEKAACLGFCVGASAVLRVMALEESPFAAGALFHPSWCVTDALDSPHRRVQSIAGQLYVAIGAADKVSPPLSNQPLIEQLALLGPRATVDIHPNAEHGFMMADSHFDANAARLSWAAAGRVLRQGTELPQD